MNKEQYDIHHWRNFIVRVADKTNDVFHSGEFFSFAFNLTLLKA